MPTELIVADIFVYAPVPFAEHCLKDTVACKKEENKRGQSQKWLQSGGQNWNWPTSWQGGYITPTAWGVPTASERGIESQVAHKWARWLHNPCRLGVPTASERGAESEVAHKWARGLHNPRRLGGPHCLRAGGTVKSGPQVGKVAT